MQLTYAVGDIHGRLDLVKRAVGKIIKHARRRSYRLVFLGDYIDRGPESRRVVDFLIELERRAGAICLRGNHEQLLLDCRDLRHGEDFRLWMQLGGVATLASYNVSAMEPEAVGELPYAHLEWLRRRPLMHQTDRQVFVHAGVDPKRALTDQRSEDLLWIRQRFLRCAPQDLVEQRHIVHGHTPIWEDKPEAVMPELLAHRTNLDTGAFSTGVLSVGVFSSEHNGPIDLIPVA